MAAKPRKTDPQIVLMPPQKMATVLTKGDPNAVGETAMKALYGSVFTLKFARKKQDPAQDFKVGKLLARWPDAHVKPREEWTGIWALAIPDDVETLPQKEPDVEVKLETWEYGTVAQILHIGPYSEEGPTVQRLHEFIQDSGYEIAGLHEEEYLTTPKAKTVKTIIRYEVQKPG